MLDGSGAFDYLDATFLFKDELAVGKAPRARLFR